jgi:hypothetical protein
MIVGTQLAKRRTVNKMSLPLNRNPNQGVWVEAGFPVRMIAKLRAAIATRVPVGYEDETGFHYSAKASDWFFSI